MKKIQILLTILALSIVGAVNFLLASDVDAGGLVTFAMANAFLTTKTIARVTTLRLVNMLVMKALVYNDYSDTFSKKGDTIRVKIPPVYVSKEFTTTTTVQDINEGEIDVVMNHLADITISWGSKERAMSIESFTEMFIDPAIEAHSQKIDEDIYDEFYKEVPYFVGVSGTTPDALQDFADATKMLNDNKVPVANRKAVWDTTSYAKFSILDAIVSAEKSGSTNALREGSIGKIQGMENFWTQNVAVHTAGTFVAVATPKVSTTAVVDSRVLVLKGGSGTETLLAGDIFTISTGGVLYYYCVLADVSASGGVATIATTTDVLVAHAVDDVIVFPDKTAGGHVANLAFIPRACAFVTRPLEVPESAKGTGYNFNSNGISMRVVSGYNTSTKVETLSVDMLYGIKATQPQLATRILG